MKSKNIEKARKQLSDQTPDIIIEALAIQIDILEESQKRIEEEGIVVRDMKGSVIQHPAIKIQKNASEEITKIIKDFSWL